MDDLAHPPGQTLEAAYDPDHSHDLHAHGTDVRRVDTGYGVGALEVFEDVARPRWSLRSESGPIWQAPEVIVITERADQVRQAFTFVDRGDYLESIEKIPEPHEFAALQRLDHDGDVHGFELLFAKHDHDDKHADALKVALGRLYGAHERYHADDITRRFGGGNVTRTHILLFGLTGGLIPQPGAIAVLLLCLQFKQITLGVILVVFFSAGLAVTTVSAGVMASLSVEQIGKRWSGFSTFARRAPYASGALMIVISFYMGISGWVGLHGGHLPAA